MTCKDIMTPDPACCVPGDSVAAAAQIMRRNDVGPVPVVSDLGEKRLVGIVTDRDLAMKVLADGRDANTTRVDEVMTLNPLSCGADESAHRALIKMAEHQIRRIPIVDDANRLLGIISQADIARHEDEEEVGQMVEHISEPYGSDEWLDDSAYRPRRWPAASSLAMGALCIGVGAGLMHAFDEGRKGARHTGRLSDEDYRSAEPTGDEAADRQLVDKIRTKIAKHVSNSRSIGIESKQGRVTLSGPILAGEVRGLLDRVSDIPGVRSVLSRLEVHEVTSGPTYSQDWGKRKRVLASLAGGGLLLYGMRSKSRTGRAMVTLGTGLLAQGVANRRFPGIGASARRMAGF